MSPTHPTRRRAGLLGIAIGIQLILASLLLAPTPASARDSELPIFTSTGALVDPAQSPTGEFIFPSVFNAGRHLENPLAEWYIYYAPHDAPGGIYLMYSDSLDGPWTQYQGNPIVSNVWPGHYDVSHVSAPDAVWNEAEGQLHLFFHGENTTMRYATSTDGTHFDYGDTLVNTSMIPNATETSYERVFPNPEPDSPYPWAMFFMVNDTSNTRKIHVARSKDLRQWDVDTTPLITPGDTEGANVSAANLWWWKGQNYVLYGATTGTIFARPVNKQLTSVGEPRPLYVPSAIPPEAGRATSPYIVQEGRQLHLFHEFGARGQTTVGHAVLDPDGVRDPINAHPEDPMWEKCTGAGSDEFDGTALDRTTWPTILREDASRHRVADDTLTLPTYAGSVDTAPLIQQELPEGDWEVTTKLRIDPRADYQQAGLMFRADDQNNLRIDFGHAKIGRNIAFIWRRNGVDRNDTWTMEDSTLPPESMGEDLWLRVFRQGDWLAAAYSVDGRTFTVLGRPVPAKELNATAFGPYAYRGPETAPEIEAAFDWVRFTPTEAEQQQCAG